MGGVVGDPPSKTISATVTDISKIYYSYDDNGNHTFKREIKNMSISFTKRDDGNYDGRIVTTSTILTMKLSMTKKDDDNKMSTSISGKLSATLTTQRKIETAVVSLPRPYLVSAQTSMTDGEVLGKPHEMKVDDLNILYSSKAFAEVSGAAQGIAKLNRDLSRIDVTPYNMPFDTTENIMSIGLGIKDAGVGTALAIGSLLRPYTWRRSGYIETKSK